MWTNLAYTWIALTNLYLGGATLYNTNEHNYPPMARDNVEVVIGSWERCEATRGTTNAEYIAPQIDIRAISTTDTNGVDNTNNIVTNAFTWIPYLSQIQTARDKADLAASFYLNTNGLTNLMTVFPSNMT